MLFETKNNSKSFNINFYFAGIKYFNYFKNNFEIIFIKTLDLKNESAFSYY